VPAPLARLGLVTVLLVPCAQASATTRCAVEAPALGADVARACAAVRAVVPGWDGRGTVVLAEGDPEVAGETVGSTVTLHRAAWARLTAAGRQEVLTHELVHVATDGIDAPLWLQEGLAEAVAMRGSGIPDRVAARELAASPVLPDHLPTDADFAAVPALAYQESWLVVDALQRDIGWPGLLRLYAAAGGPRSGSSDSDRGRAWLDTSSSHDLVALLRAEIGRRLS
jgi:hypothetical protein